MSRASRAAPFRRDLFHRVLRTLDDDGPSAAFVLDQLPDRFSGDELDRALQALHDQLVTCRGATETIDRIRWVAASNYEVTFPAGSSISAACAVTDRSARGPRHGDARLVRFVDDDGATTYYATYTASMAPTSRRTSWPPPTSARSPAPSSQGEGRGTRAWPCFPDASTVDTSPSRAGSRNQRRRDLTRPDRVG